VDGFVGGVDFGENIQARAVSGSRWTYGGQCLVTGVATQVYDLVDRPRAMNV
jgi:ABC-type antimicrobial peptide transport system permease subunit